MTFSERKIHLFPCQPLPPPLYPKCLSKVICLTGHSDPTTSMPFLPSLELLHCPPVSYHFKLNSPSSCLNSSCSFPDLTSSSHSLTPTLLSFIVSIYPLCTRFSAPPFAMPCAWYRIPLPLLGRLLLQILISAHYPFPELVSSSLCLPGIALGLTSMGARLGLWLVKPVRAEMSVFLLVKCYVHLQCCHK